MSEELKPCSASCRGHATHPCEKCGKQWGRPMIEGLETYVCFLGDEGRFYDSEGNRKWFDGSVGFVKLSDHKATEKALQARISTLEELNIIKCNSENVQDADMREHVEALEKRCGEDGEEIASLKKELSDARDRINGLVDALEIIDCNLCDMKLNGECKDYSDCSNCYETVAHEALAKYRNKK